MADIGAGTGILTKHFVNRVKFVFAIEPNLEMRQMAIKDLGQCPSFRIIEGRAEATTLPDRSVDLITIAQAIHWFEPEPAKIEFWRILKATGWLAVLRNYVTDDKLNKAIGEILIPENGVDISPATKQAQQKPISFYYGGHDFQKFTFPFSIQETWAGFIGSLSSASYTPVEDNHLYPNLERAAKKVFDRFSDDGLLELQGATEVFLGQINPA
jgi:ubiquinone/menaquinone biosynthesis C-methylase UbiE